MSFSFFPSKNSSKPSSEDDAGAKPRCRCQMSLSLHRRRTRRLPGVVSMRTIQRFHRSWKIQTFQTLPFSLSPSDFDTPRFHRNPDAMDSCVMPRRTADTISVVDALNDGQADDDIDSDTESDYGREATLEDDPQAIRESTRHQPRDPRNAADDSDVIEVVKVSRRSKIPQEHNDAQSIRMRSDVKHSQTLKSRASKVFRSLKGSLRHSKPRAQDVFAPSPPVPSLPKYPDTQPLPREEAPSRPRTPTVSRRGSKILTQLFTAPSLKSQSSMSSFDDQAAASPRQSITSPTSSVFSIGNPTSLHNPSIYSAAMQDEARLQAASPTPTTSSSKSATRRFSMQSLQKLFSFSSASPAPPISVTTPIMHDDSSRTTPTPRSTSSTPPSVLSSTSGPQTPTSSEEVTHVRLVSRKDTADIPGFDSFESVFDTNVGLNLGLGLGLNLDPDLDVEKTPRKPNRVQSLKNTWDAVAPKRFSRAPLPSSLDDNGDMSLEMRLDSFHFDSLSFDADNFIAN
ncbi:hypothetical protein BJ912DRAFT_198202 [Pholiota molesta]|nr:hypothetical protein BJ912DRAFT_198202 [Pholiota molesta]